MANKKKIKQLIYLWPFDSDNDFNIGQLNIDGVNPLSLLNLYFKNKNSFLVDSNNILNKYSNYNLYDNETLSFPNNYILDIDTLIDNRANAVVNYCKVNNLKPTLFYSGGVDSTAILCSLLKITNDVAIVIDDYYSINYNPEFYNRFIKDKLEILELKKIYLYKNRFKYIIENKELENYCFISGDCVDHLFVTDFLNTHQNLYNMNWKDAFKKTINSDEFSLVNINIDEYIDIYSDYMNMIGFNDVEYFYEFMTLFNYYCSYNTERYIVNCRYKNIINSNVIVFFDTPKFNCYIMNYFNKVRKDKVNHYVDTKFYKTPLKKYIYKFDNNEYDLLYKQKTANNTTLGYLSGYEYALNVYYTDGTETHKYLYNDLFKDVEHKKIRTLQIKSDLLKLK